MNKLHTNKLHIKKGDTVKILVGKDRGKTGKVLNAFPKKNKVVVEGINVFKKHQRSRKGGQSGQVIERAMPVHVSNIVLTTTKEAKVKTNKKPAPVKANLGE